MNKNILKLAIVGLACVQAPIKALPGQSWVNANAPWLLAANAAINYTLKNEYNATKSSALKTAKHWAVIPSAFTLLMVARGTKGVFDNPIYKNIQGVGTFHRSKGFRDQSATFCRNIAALAGTYLAAQEVGYYAKDQWNAYRKTK